MGCWAKCFAPSGRIAKYCIHGSYISVLFYCQRSNAYRDRVAGLRCGVKRILIAGRGVPAAGRALPSIRKARRSGRAPVANRLLDGGSTGQ